MSDVVAIRVKCPECGATMRVTADVVTCTYCGREARVQRRTQVFQRAIELPPLGASHPSAVAVQQPSTARWLVFGLLVVGSVSAIGVFSASVQRSPDLAPSSPPPAQRAGIWTTPRPLLTDIDGDGIEDAIGFVRRTGAREGVYLRTVAGSSGKPLWESPSVGTYTQNDRAALALAPGVVLFADTEYKPRLEAYDLRTGAKRWSITPGEVVRDLCRDRDGHVKLVTKDEQATSIELATGAAAALPRSARCVHLPSTEDRIVMMDTNNPHWGFAPPGMASYGITGDSSSWILTGSKSPGSDVPMIAVIDERSRVKWKTELASTDPLSSRWPLDQVVAHDATLVATVYGRKGDNQPRTLVAFDRATGARRFETTIEHKGSWYLTGVTLEVGPTAVWVAVEDAVRAYDRQTGALRWQMAAE